MKTETISYKSLKQLLKFSIAINLELGLIVSYTQCYIEIDKYENRCTDYKKMYAFEIKDLNNIITLVHAYVKLHKRNLNVL